MNYKIKHISFLMYDEREIIKCNIGGKSGEERKLAEQGMAWQSRAVQASGRLAGYGTVPGGSRVMGAGRKGLITMQTGL